MKNIYLLLSVLCFPILLISQVRMVTDLTPGAESTFQDGDQSLLATVNNKALFQLENHEENWELWVSNGDEANTFSLLTGTPGFTFSHFLNYQQDIIFQLQSADSTEFWRTDGTVDGTVMLFSQAGPANYPLIMSDHLYFQTSEGSEGDPLWKFDLINGTAAEVVYTFPAPYGILNQKLLNDSTLIILGATDEGRAVFISDGTTTGTEDFYLLNDGNEPNQTPFLVRVNDAAYFFYNTFDGFGNHYFLYHTDGTAEGTTLLKEFELSSYNTNDINELDGIVALAWEGQLLFRARPLNSSFSTQQRLFISDGTSEGTVALDPSTNTYLQPGNFTPYNDQVYFMGAFIGVSFSIFKTQGTMETTAQAIDHSELGIEGASFGGTYLTVFNDSLFFEGSLLNTGTELWASDGTTEGTRLIDIVQGSSGTSPRDLIATEDLLFFTAFKSGIGRELYVYEPEGCQPVSSSLNVAICQGEIVDINGTTYSESGVYEQILQTEDGCDSTLAIMLEINELPIIDLGDDIVISENDSIQLEAEGMFDSILWSDGTMESSLWLIANDYGVGMHEVFAEATNTFGCAVSDTIVVTVEPVSSVDDLSKAPGWSILLHPNPVDRNAPFQLQFDDLAEPTDMVQLEWFNSNGKRLSRQVIENIRAGTKVSLVAPNHAGLYFLKLSDNGGQFISKKVVVE